MDTNFCMKTIFRFTNNAVATGVDDQRSIYPVCVILTELRTDRGCRILPMQLPERGRQSEFVLRNVWMLWSALGDSQLFQEDLDAFINLATKKKRFVTHHSLTSHTHHSLTSLAHTQHSRTNSHQYLFANFMESGEMLKYCALTSLNVKYYIFLTAWLLSWHTSGYV